MGTDFDERQMYENKRVQTMVQFWLLLALTLVTGAVVFTYMYLNRPPEAKAPPVISIDACKAMCGEGVEKYDGDVCLCKKPKPATHLNCTCSPEEPK